MALTACDHRLHPRYTVQVQIELHLEGNDVPMRLATIDLSRAGCDIELMMRLSVGTPIQAALWLDGHPIVIRGRVLTCHPQYGYGMMFEKFEDQAEQLLQQYLDATVTTT